ncbi:MAG: succinate--CoA ligase subunit alpha, partial [Nitrosopumilus sp.]
MTDIFELLKGKPEDSDYMKKGVIVQGITGVYGTIHTTHMIADGTNIVAGVTPGKGGQKFQDSVPIYNTMQEAVDATNAKISILFVPAKFFLGAAKDALEAGIKLLVAIPEHVPIRDTMETLALAEQKGAIVIGPNTPGNMIPELIKIGIMPVSPFMAGKIA